MQEAVQQGTECGEARAPEVVMSPERAAAAYPNALSFSRRLVRRMAQERWRIDTVRIHLDEMGRGEALYSIDSGGLRFLYFVVSDYFPPEQKVDRSFGVNWDVSAALCEGEWTVEREAILRNEIPKQYDGRFDPGVLCFCRGNRSERIFDHVVDSLAANSQPDANLLGSVGYILRSTAFVANGLFGMLPFSSFPSGHPLGRSYDAQILAAYMLRHFVFDLVNCMAARRSAQAAELDRRIKRYLGVGNSAGLGLVPFVASHPHIINRWVAANEGALAQAKTRNVHRQSDEAVSFLKLLDKAILYFQQAPLDGNNVFASYDLISAELIIIKQRTDNWLNSLRDPSPWSDLLSYLEENFHLETIEILYGLWIELYPDIVRDFENLFDAQEQEKTARSESVNDLKAKLESSYSWLLDELADAADCTAYFWYYPVEAPYEPRRGRRACAREADIETAMDLPLKIVHLSEALRAAPDEELIACFAARYPELGAVIARVQHCADLPFAELRQNFISANFSPYAACRFLLAFYGMEKFDPRPPRSTKGALLQGAPLADEVAAGKDGDWPFPLIPEISDNMLASENRQPFRSLERQEVASKRLILDQIGDQRSPCAPDPTVIFMPELKKLVLKSLLVDNVPLGAAQNAFHLLDLALRLGLSSINDVLSLLRHPDQLIAYVPDSQEDPDSDLSLQSFLPTALDIGLAKSSSTSRGFLFATTPCNVLGAASALHIARMGALGVVANLGSGTLNIGGPSPDGAWLARLPTEPAWATRGVNLDLEPGSWIWSKNAHSGDNKEPCVSRVLVLPIDTRRSCLLLRELQASSTPGAKVLMPSELEGRDQEIARKGHLLSQAELEVLRQLAYRALVPEELECGFAS